MSHRSILAFVILLTFLIPVAAYSQQDGQERATFTSEDGLLTFSYPAGWAFLDSYDDLFLFPYVVLAPSEEMVERVAYGELEPGDQVIYVYLLPEALLEMFDAKVELPESATPGELAALVAELSWVEMGEGEAFELGEAEDIKLSEDITLGAITFRRGADEGVLFVRDLGDGLLGLTPAAARLGEFDDTLRHTAQEIAASVEFTGTTEALLKEIMGPLDLETEPPGSD